jgi:hypothetical protein
MSTPQDRLKTKRLNERLKLGATFFNGVAIANVIVVVLAPLAQTMTFSVGRTVVGIVGAIIFHLIAQAVLALLRSEE